MELHTCVSRAIWSWELSFHRIVFRGPSVLLTSEVVTLVGAKRNQVVLGDKLECVQGWQGGVLRNVQLLKKFPGIVSVTLIRDCKCKKIVE